MRRNSLTHLARGADGVLFFQWRQSRAGAEKWHSAMVPHAGTRSRIWREVSALGAELATLAEVTGTRVHSDVALLFDWHSWWALELQARPSAHLHHLGQVRDWYEALWRENITCDVVAPGADLSRYRAVLAPNLYLLTDADAENLDRYVEHGGHLAVGCFSGVVDAHDRIRPGAHPGALRELLGIRVDEYLPLRPGQDARLEDGTTARRWAERVEPDPATTLLRFADGPQGGPARGGPAMTRNLHGRGTARYVATCPSTTALGGMVRDLCAQAGVRPAAATPPGVEAVRREGPDGSYLFLVNHTAEDATVPVGHATGLAATAVRDGLALVPCGGAAVVREDRSEPHG